jgi:hypothetical protein
MAAKNQMPDVWSQWRLADTLAALIIMDHDLAYHKQHMNRHMHTPPWPPGDKAASRRSRAARVSLVLLVVLIPTGVYLYQHRPNLYDHARTDLLQASRELDIYTQDMEQLAQKDRNGAKALKATIHMLQQAASSDPADLAEINAITVALEDWEDRVHAGKLSADELRSRYRALEARVQHLIDQRPHTAQSH